MNYDLLIQPYAFVLVFDTDKRRLTAYSDNLPVFLGADAGAMLSLNASHFFTKETYDLAHRNASFPFSAPAPLHVGQPVNWGDRQLLSRMVNGRLLLEIEPIQHAMSTDALQGQLLEFSQAVRADNSLTQVLKAGCDRIATTFGFDRVTVYQFDQSSCAGRNVVESNNGSLPSLLDVHFREEDFPPESREKLLLNPVLVIGPPIPGRPVMRGDYYELATVIANELGCRTGFDNAELFLLENDLGTQLNVTLTVSGRLWGSILGHAKSPRYLDQRQRRYARLVGIQMEREIFAIAQFNAHRSTLIIDSTRAMIRQQISQADDLQQGLTTGTPSLVDYLSESKGAAILVEDKLTLLGDSPDADKVTELLNWAAGTVEDDNLFITDRLQGLYPTTKTHLETDPAGALLAPLDKRRSEWIVWFRPEWIVGVDYGSRRHDNQDDGSKRYVATQETRRGYSLPWSEDEIAAARELQSFVREVVVEKYGRLKRVNRQLKIAYDEMEAFSYTVSHDLRAPLRGIDGFAEILVEDYGKELSPDAADLVRNIQQNVARMNEFISDLLKLSRAGRSSLIINDCRMDRLVEEAMASLGSKAEVTLQEAMPPVRGDHRQLQLVVYHLVSNAVKYSSRETVQRIEVGYRDDGKGRGEFFVTDNGIGIDPQHHQRIFGMFNRLVTKQEFAGNGVGLAIVNRIINRHLGNIRVESEPGSGSTFYFYTKPD